MGQRFCSDVSSHLLSYFFPCGICETTQSSGVLFCLLGLLSYCG